MHIRRRLQGLELTELNKLVDLVHDAVVLAGRFSEGLVGHYCELAAECALELWLRTDARGRDSINSGGPSVSTLEGTGDTWH